jgi:hypothetical protein
LKIFNHTGLISGSQKSSRMSEFHCSYGSIVRLKNGFEVERQTIPEGEFSTG